MLTCDIQIRDPFILKHGGLYYMYGSTDKDIWKSAGVGFDAYVGRDLKEWDGPLEAFRPPEGFWGIKNFWAPEVYEHDGAFYMFSSFMGDNSTGAYGKAGRGTAILRSENPRGPFTPWSCGAVTPREWMCLDGTLYKEPDGTPWIVFCHEWVQTGDGTVCAMRLSGDLRQALSEPVTLFKSSDAAWSHKAFSPSNNIEGYVTDGCFLHRTQDGTLLLLWSCIGADGYCLGYAVSESGAITGPWHQAEKPLFADDGGHGMLFRSYDQKLLLALHTPNKTPDERAVFIEMAETKGGLRVAE